MDLEDFNELFEYNQQVRKNYLHSFQEIIRWEEMIKNHETAWLSLKDTLLHIIWVEDTWINYSIQGLDDPNRPFPYHKYQTWNALIDYNEEVTSKTKRYLSNIQKKDLDTVEEQNAIPFDVPNVELGQERSWSSKISKANLTIHP